MASREAEHVPQASTGPVIEMGDDSEDMMARIADAEAKLAALAEQYEALVQQDLDELHSLVARFDTEPAARPAIADQMYTISHNIKGQGASFGYQMLTDIANSLCVFLRDHETPTDGHSQIIRHHLSAMKVVVDKHIKGDGGDLGRQVVLKLQSLVAG